MGTEIIALQQCQSIPTYITKTWCTNVWRFMHKHNFSLDVKSSQIVKKKRQNDKYIMDMCQKVPPQKHLQDKNERTNHTFPHKRKAKICRDRPIDV